MYRKRILKAYEILKTIPKKNLRLVAWISHKEQEHPTCNTIACAGGWLSMHPDFKNKGLELGVLGLGSYQPEYKDLSGYEALAKFFQISFNEAKFLFGPEPLTVPDYDRTKDKKIVLKRFKDFIKKHNIV